MALETKSHKKKGNKFICNNFRVRINIFHLRSEKPYRVENTTNLHPGHWNNLRCSWRKSKKMATKSQHPPNPKQSLWSWFTNLHYEHLHCLTWFAVVSITSFLNSFSTPSHCQRYMNVRTENIEEWSELSRRHPVDTTTNKNISIKQLKHSPPIQSLVKQHLQRSSSVSMILENQNLCQWPNPENPLEARHLLPEIRFCHLFSTYQKKL